MMPFFEFDSWNLVSAFVLIAAIQLFLFVFAALFKTDKLTDLAYGATFAIVAGWLLVFQEELSFSAQLIAWAVILWGLRLSGYLFVRILKIGKDVRFDGRRETVLAFAPFWALQTATIWIVLLPLLIVAGTPGAGSPGPALLVGMLIFAVGLAVETVADQQKFAFRNDPANRGLWIESGLWKYSRYPNYFGEILVWWGLWIAIVPVISGWTWVSVVGPMFITFLLLRVSGIPLLEQEQERKYGSDPMFRDYVARTNRLIPGRPRAGAGV